MYPSTEATNSTIPFPTYVTELHELFTMHRMRFGSPEDVVPFAEALSTPGTFHDEMTSMIRSIFLRHGGNVPRAELLQLVMIAVGGPLIDEAAEHYLPAIQETVKFLGEVHRTRWGVIPTELQGADAADAFADAPPRFVPESTDTDKKLASVVHPEKSAAPAVETPRESLPPRRSPEIFFRSQMMKPTSEAGAADDLTTSPELPAPDPAAVSAIAVPDVVVPEVVTPVAAAPVVAAPVPAVREVAAPTLATAIDSARAQPSARSVISAPDATDVVPSKKRKVLWIIIVAVLLLVAALAGVLFYEQYLEDKNWPTRNLPPAATTSPTAPPSPVKRATKPKLTAGASAIRDRATPRPARRQPLPPVTDPIDPASTGEDQTNVTPETVPSTPQQKPPAPIIRIEPAPSPVTTTPNPPPTTTGTPPQ